MALVTASDVQIYTAMPALTADQVTALNAICNGVQSALEVHLNRVLEPRFIRETRKTDSGGYFAPMFAPVQEIVRIGAFNTTMQLGPSYDMWSPLDPAPDYGTTPTTFTTPIGNGTSMIHGNLIYIGVPNRLVTVEYLTGAESVITPYLPAVQLAITRVAAREFMILHDSTMALSKEAIDIDENIRRTPRGWSPQELIDFDRIRRRTVL